MSTLEETFAQAYGEFADAIFRHCAFRLRDRERGKDLMQETFTRLWTELQRGVHVENMRAFLYRIANNLVIDDVRKHRPCSLEELQESGWDIAGDGADDVKRDTELREVLEALDTLDAPARQVIVMRYIDGLGPSDIARILEEAPNTVSVRLHRAVQTLRVSLKHEPPDAGNPRKNPPSQPSSS